MKRTEMILIPVEELKECLRDLIVECLSDIKQQATEQPQTVLLNEECWFNTEEACQELRVSSTTMYRLRKSDQIKWRRIGRKYLVDICDYLDRQDQL